MTQVRKTFGILRQFLSNSAKFCQKCRKIKNENHVCFKNAKECLMGEGFDRHIFGLRHQATKNGLDLVCFRTLIFFNYSTNPKTSLNFYSSPSL